MSDPYVESLRRGFKSRNIPGSCTIVIFGATGDLTHRKLIPALYNLYINNELNYVEAVWITKNKKVLNNIKLQFQNNNKLISIRTPYLSIEESNNLIINLEDIVGSLNYESKDSRLIGPKLGKRLLTNCITSL